MLFDRICAENGIRHLLTAPRSPTTTGKVERLHKTMRAEFFTDARPPVRHHRGAAGRRWTPGWCEYNTERPHQALGMRPPAERFDLVPAPEPVTTVVPARHRPRPRAARSGSCAGGLRPAGCAGCSGGSDGQGRSGWPGSSTGCRSCWPGSRWSAWSPRTWCRSSTAGAGRLLTSTPPSWPQGRTASAGRRSARAADTGRRSAAAPVAAPKVTRMVDTGGSVSFAGTTYRAGSRWVGHQVSVAVIGKQVRIEIGQAADQGAPHPARPGQGARRLRPPGRTPGRLAKKATAGAARLDTV